MAGKQAKILSADHIDDLLFFADRSRHALRNRVMVLLSIKAGLRAGEIANLTWQMVLNAAGEINTIIELRDHVAKMGSGRTVPVHADLRDALKAHRQAVRDIVHARASSCRIIGTPEYAPMQVEENLKKSG